MSLLEYLPEFIQEIKEMKVIMSVEENFLTGFDDNLNLAVKNNEIEIVKLLLEHPSYIEHCSCSFKKKIKSKALAVISI